ncbi:lectin [Rhizobacter sp. OV335]|jgi:hypothetical protein|uniref:lectin n=1 Tax=Rhizobacter sp. OV335 TaxID=1500264 RepID=UPI0009115A1A|nr:lectin [Rhizobacter sp. OV335]SHN39645.1 hypothetical protein SAMN02787076_06102 [Rhizobacter sp. OV335]
MIHRQKKLLAALACAAIGSVQAQTAASAPRPAEPPKPFTFFVTSEGTGKGADLGGLAGADAHCKKLASAVGNGAKTWRAYLSTQEANGQPAVNARDRIGAGPWTNARGAVVARDLAHLHGDTLELARLGSNLTRNTVFTERNEPIKGSGDRPNQHDILTGSLPDGTAFADGADHTCRNYGSSAPDGSAQVGHFDRTGGGNSSWNSAHASRGCGQENLVSTGGAGLFYFFAID